MTGVRAEMELHHKLRFLNAYYVFGQLILKILGLQARPQPQPYPCISVKEGETSEFFEKMLLL